MRTTYKVALNLLNILLIVSICLLSISCATSNQVNNATYPTVGINVDFDNATDNAVDFFDSYKYSVLQSNGDIPLGMIDLIDFSQDKIVIVSGTTIHIYQHDGKEIACFNKKGHGPEEYLHIQDITCSGNRIYVLSWLQKKILEYDFKGQFIESYELPYAYAALQKTEQGIWLASESNNDSYFDFSLYNNTNKKLIANCFPFELNQSTHSSVGLFNPFVFSDSEETLVVKQYDYSVYGLNENGGYCAWKYNINTPKQISDFGKDLSYVELYQTLSNQPVVMWPGLLWKGKENVYQTLSVFYILGRFTNIYKFSLDHPDEKGKLLHIGLKSYDEFPFLRSKVIAINNGNYISMLPLKEALKIATSNNIDFNTNDVTDEDAQVIFFHHFKE